MPVHSSNKLVPQLCLGITCALLGGGASFAMPPAPDESRLTGEQLREIDNFLSDYYKNVVIIETVRGQHNETISCVDIFHQPGLDGSEELQLRPSDEFIASLPGPFYLAQDSNSPSICPKGSVPMRLPTREAIIRMGSLKNYHSKHPNNSTNLEAPALVNETHEYAAQGQAVNANGAQSTFNIWTPPSVAANEVSLSQLWLTGGSGSTLQTVEVGYQRYDAFYGDAQPHLFVYYTPDNYTTGCYNLTCNAFVGTNSSINVGDPLPSSTAGGAQIEGTVAFYLDSALGRWWLLYWDTLLAGYVDIGYYPVALFDTGQLSKNATAVKFGGEVYVSGGTPHSITDMGSGQFSGTGYGFAAYQRNLKYMDLSSVIQNFSHTTQYITNSDCYSLTGGTDPTWDSSFYFGGPGYNSVSCPLAVQAVELRHDGIDCTMEEPREASSRFTVLDNIGNFYRIWIDGGLPSFDKTTPECIDIFFRELGSASPPGTESREAYAIYYAPYLFVLISASKADSATTADGVPRKSNFMTTHVFTFEADADANFILLNEEWMGVDHAGITHSGLMIYDQPEQIAYRLVF